MSAVDSAPYAASLVYPQQPGLMFVTEEGTYCELSATAPGGGKPYALCATGQRSTKGNAVQVTAAKRAGMINANRPLGGSGVATLPAGSRLQDGAATCSVSSVGVVTCSVGEHGFTLNPDDITTW